MTVGAYVGMPNLIMDLWCLVAKQISHGWALKNISHAMIITLDQIFRFIPKFGSFWQSRSKVISVTTIGGQVRQFRWQIMAKLTKIIIYENMWPWPILLLMLWEVEISHFWRYFFINFFNLISFFFINLLFLYGAKSYRYLYLFLEILNWLTKLIKFKLWRMTPRSTFLFCLIGSYKPYKLVTLF